MVNFLWLWFAVTSGAIIGYVLAATAAVVRVSRAHAEGRSAARAALGIPSHRADSSNPFGLVRGNSACEVLRSVAHWAARRRAERP